MKSLTELHQFDPDTVGSGFSILVEAEAVGAGVTSCSGSGTSKMVRLLSSLKLRFHETG
jgi:hypothetical protein